METVVIIPAFNEEQSIAQVVQSIPQDWVSEILVVDNGSTDLTAQQARECGARVVYESRRGYGSACLRGLAEMPPCDIVVFLDADFSDDPQKLPELVQPIRENQADLVIGSRILGRAESGALPAHAKFGNRLACFLIKRLFGVAFSDLGPFRAVRTQALRKLGMRDTNYGWTVEMQARAAFMGLRCVEIPVPYRVRIGRSKISGTIQGSVKAGTKILWTIFSLWLRQNTLLKQAGLTNREA